MLCWYKSIDVANSQQECCVGINNSIDVANHCLGINNSIDFVCPQQQCYVGINNSIDVANLQQQCCVGITNSIDVANPQQQCCVGITNSIDVAISQQECCVGINNGKDVANAQQGCCVADGSPHFDPSFPVIDDQVGAACGHGWWVCHHCWRSACCLHQIWGAFLLWSACCLHQNFTANFIWTICFEIIFCSVTDLLAPTFFLSYFSAWMRGLLSIVQGERCTYTNFSGIWRKKTNMGMVIISLPCHVRFL